MKSGTAPIKYIDGTKREIIGGIHAKKHTLCILFFLLLLLFSPSSDFHYC